MLHSLIKVQEEIHANMKGIQGLRKPLKIFKFLKTLKIPSLPEEGTMIILRILVIKALISKHHPKLIITQASSKIELKK